MLRTGYGLYYGAFENRGGNPSLGYNYPFQFTLVYESPNDDLAEPTAGWIARRPRCPRSDRSRSGQRQRERPDAARCRVRLQDAAVSQLQRDAADRRVAESLDRDRIRRHAGTQPRDVHRHEQRERRCCRRAPTRSPYVDWPDFARGSLLVRTVGVSSYDSLQTKFRRRYARRVGVPGELHAERRRRPTPATRCRAAASAAFARPIWPAGILKNDIGLSGFHTKHAFVFSGNYDLPGHGSDPRRLAHQLGGVALQRPGADHQLLGGDRVRDRLLCARGRRSVRRQPQRDAVLQSGRVCDPESGCHDRSDRLQPARRQAQPGDRTAVATTRHGLCEADSRSSASVSSRFASRPSTSRTRRRSTCPDR